MSATPEPSVQPISFSRLGRRLRHHDVGAADHHGAPEPLPVIGPRVQGDDGRARPDRPAGRLGERGVARAEPRHRRVLEDPHAALEEHAAHPAREARRDARSRPPCGTRRRGTPARRCACASPPPTGPGSARSTPSRSAVMTPSAQRPTWSSEAATTYSPSARYQASIPSSSQKPSDRLARCPRRHRRARSRLGRRTVRARYSRSPQNEFTKPPLRPLAPPPAMSCSRITMSTPGSSLVRWRAVHMPV